MRVLIVKSSALGDVVQTFPIVEYLKKRQKCTHIGWAVESHIAPLVRAHPLVDHVIEIDSKKIRSLFPKISFFQEIASQRKSIRAQEWDMVIDLQGNCKSAIVTRLARAPVKIGYGMCTVAEMPNIIMTNARYNPPLGLSVRDEYMWIIQKHFVDEEFFASTSVELLLSESQQLFLKEERKRWPRTSPVWAIVPGSKWKAKTCRIDTLIEVLEKVHDQFGAYFLFTAGSDEEVLVSERLAKHFSHSSHVLNHLEFPVLQRALGSVDAVVSVDSFVLHLAGTTVTPTFGLFGPSKGSRYAPSSWFQAPCPKGQDFSHRCPCLRLCSSSCLQQVESSDFFNQIVSWQNTL